MSGTEALPRTQAVPHIPQHRFAWDGTLYHTNVDLRLQWGSCEHGSKRRSIHGLHGRIHHLDFGGLLIRCTVILEAQ